MSKAEYEKVDAFDVPGALNGEKIELPENSNDADSDVVTEHIYVVFSDDISIENGIELIEDEVLSGEELDVRRQDESGHAIVCVVSSSQRAAISKKDYVLMVKVEGAAVPTTENEEDSSESDESTDAQEPEAGDDAEAEVTLEDTSTASEVSGDEGESEIAGEASSVVSDDHVPAKNDISSFNGITIAAVLVLAAVCIAFFLRKK